MNSREDVKVFQGACDQTDTGFGDQSSLYLDLIAEEFNEVLDAYHSRDLPHLAKELADLKWVIEGLENTLKIPKQLVWDELTRSNMSKISDNGKVIKNAAGKVQKPDTYSPADIEKIYESIYELPTELVWDDDAERIFFMMSSHG